jgi:hypothetical protein
MSLLGTTIAATAVVLTSAGAASALSGGVHAGFAAQARGAGLSGAQARLLQRRVSSFIARHGGTQAAINKVTLANGSMVFALPGEGPAGRARASATELAASSSWSTCPLGDFCTWNGTNYGGNAKREYYYCREAVQPFTDIGSWKNDETPQDGTGPQAQILYDDGYRYLTPHPWCANSSWVWADTFGIIPC